MIRRRKSWHATLLNNWQFLSSPSLPSQFWYQSCPSPSGSARSEAGWTAAWKDSLSLRPGAACSTHHCLWLGVTILLQWESGGSRVTENTWASPVLTAELWVRGPGPVTSPPDPIDTAQATSHSQRLVQCQCSAARPAPFSRALTRVFFYFYS